MNELLKQDLQEEEQEYQGFQVTDIESANWSFRKLRAIKEQKAEFEALAAKEIKRIKEWQEKEIGKLESQEVFFNGLLMEYAKKQRQNDPKFKVSTPYGKVTFRKQQPKWVYEDKEVIECLKDSFSLEYIRVKEELDKENLKKAVIVRGSKVVLTETGEEIAGITVMEQEEAIKIEIV